MELPIFRPRRLRKTESLRRLVSENRLSPDNFIYPLFVSETITEPEPIKSMPGIFSYPLKDIAKQAETVYKSGVPAILLFGIPAHKDATGSAALKKDGIVQKAIQEIKAVNSDIAVITDVCFCEYTDHGHCGIITNNDVDNDATLEILAAQALSHAEAGADIVAPSDMMDGRVAAIREILDENNYTDIGLMAYSAKYCSAFYGPFREAAQSSPQFGDRRTYQMDPTNAREAMKEIELDVDEGADIIMVKPALSYLDIIYQAKERFDLPVAAYNVSGEYSMVQLMAQNDLAEEKRLALEILTSIKRAGADIIISYHAKDIGKWLNR